MERLQVQKFQLRLNDKWEKNKETNHKPPNPLKQSSSHYEEVIYSIQKWLIDGDLDSKETKENQVYTYEIDPSPMLEHKQNGQRHVKEVLDTLNFPIRASSTQCWDYQCSPIFKIGQGTSEKQPMDLPKVSRFSA